MDFFTDKNIISPLMKHYKDFAYVNYILDLPFDRAFILYKQCIDEIKDEMEEKSKDRMFQVWLEEQRRGSKETFEKYLKRHKKITETNNMSIDEKTEEETRIIDKITTGVKTKKFKETRFQL
jgi:hypothetical protein